MDPSRRQLNKENNLRNLLLRSLLSDDDNFLSILAEWEDRIDFEELDFLSFMLLPAVHQKLPNSFESRLTGRIKGAYRRTWTENQLLFNNLPPVFASLQKAKIGILLFDENFRLIEIYQNIGVFSLQNFLIAAPVSCKNEIIQILSDHLWEKSLDDLQQTDFEKDKVLQIRILWLDEETIASQLKNTELTSVGTVRQPLICQEEQILNLCENDFLILGDQSVRWQLIVSKIFQTKEVNGERLISQARKRGLIQPLGMMLEHLRKEFGIKIPSDLLRNLEVHKSAGRFFSIKRKFQNLRNSYRIFEELHEQSGLCPEVLKFLSNRWKIDSKKNFFKHAVKSVLRLLQAK